MPTARLAKGAVARALVCASVSSCAASSPSLSAPRVAQAAGPTTDVLVAPWPSAPKAGAKPPPTELASPWKSPPAAPPSVARPPASLPAHAAQKSVSTWRGGTVIPADAPGASSCGLSAQGVPGKAVGYCARVAHGPLLLTDLHVSGHCRADLYALAGTLAEPTWIAFVPALSHAHITGASLAVLAEGDLIVGVGAPSEAPISHDLRCSVTWAGWAMDRPSFDGDLGF